MARRWLPGFLLLAVVAGGAAVPASVGPRGPATDSDRAAFLRRQLARFQALPPARQEQIRELDRQLHELDEPTRDRLFRVMEEYADWLDRLPEADRQRVKSAADANERLRVVRDLREKEWLKSLPKTYREQYAAAKPAEQARLVEKWRLEEQERREEWVIARQHWDELKTLEVPAMFQPEDFRSQVQHFADKRLLPRLSPEERKRVEAARWNPITYGRLLVEMTDKHPILPGLPDGPDPTRFEQLPRADQTFIEKHAKLAKAVRAINPSLHTWPEYARAVTAAAHQQKLALPVVLLPARPDEMPADVRDFINKTLTPRVKPADLEKLKHAEGKWPDYPKLVLELAKQNRLSVPGSTLPGPPEGWSKFRVKRRR